MGKKMDTAILYVSMAATMEVFALSQTHASVLLDG
jgi:hypothetical protein